jgi:hypothetical protein
VLALADEDPKSSTLIATTTTATPTPTTALITPMMRPIFAAFGMPGMP